MSLKVQHLIITRGEFKMPNVRDLNVVKLKPLMGNVTVEQAKEALEKYYGPIESI